MMMTEPTIGKFMTMQPQTIESTATIGVARDIMARFGIRHLPVTRKGKLVGVLSEREINLAYSLEAMEPTSLLVIDICSEDPYVVVSDEPLRVVALEMANKHYDSAIVMEEDKVSGIFTSVDALRALSCVIEEGIEMDNLRYVSRIRHLVS